MQSKFWVSAVLLVLFSGCVHAQGSPADEKAIRDVEAQWEAAWNSHDTAAMVRLFAPDADVINLAGEWFQGRDAFEKSLKTLHSVKVKESVWQTEEVHIKFLTPETAIVHVYFNTRGERSPDGTPMPPRRGIFTRVEVKRSGHWMILASQATTIVPPQSAGMRGRSDGSLESDALLARLHP